MEALPSLPAPIFRQILTLAVYGFSDELLPQPMRRLPVDELRALALVAKDWAAPVMEILALAKLQRLEILLKAVTREELAEHKRRVTLSGRHVRDLTISFGDYGARAKHFRRRPKLRNVDSVSLPWRELFAHMPSLQRLDVSNMPLSSPHLIAILDAASTLCPELQALLLPGKEHKAYFEEVDDRDDDLDGAYVSEVYSALEKWCANSSGRGLRQLSFPRRPGSDQHLQSTKYIESVIASCPNVEYLDGHKLSLSEMERLTCEDEWIVSKATWERFNQRCVRLKEFNWVVAPFKDDFFQVFGAHIKPQLMVLKFAVSMLWDWERYFHQVGDANRSLRRRSDYGVGAADAKAALKGCPALRDLEVALYHPVDEHMLDPMQRYDHGDFDFLVNVHPRAEVLNMNTFGDEFCIAVTKHCPLLERLAMWEVAEGYNENPVPIEAFTDRGLEALSQLRWLEWLELRPINCSGGGLFALLNDFPDDFGGQRDLQISVGGPTAQAKLKFYDAVAELLARILTAPVVRFANRRVTLRLNNSSFKPIDRAWSLEYLEKLETLVKDVRAKYPTIQLRCRLNGRKDGAFANIAQFGLFTSHATPSEWYGWIEEKGTTLTDGVFMERFIPQANFDDEEEEDESNDDYDMERFPGGAFAPSPFGGYNFGYEESEESDNDDHVGSIFW